MWLVHCTSIWEQHGPSLRFHIGSLCGSVHIHTGLQQWSSIWASTSHNDFRPYSNGSQIRLLLLFLVCFLFSVRIYRVCYTCLCGYREALHEPDHTRSWPQIFLYLSEIKLSPWNNPHLSLSLTKKKLSNPKPARSSWIMGDGWRVCSLALCSN